jgi:hypothetical protein
MVASIRRKHLRLQLSVNRKSTAIRWMNAWVVRIHVSKRKADEGAERSCRTRRRRRGQRAGKPRSRGGKPRSNAGRPAPQAKTESSRVFNHKARKNLWAAKAANRLARRPEALRLMRNLPDVTLLGVARSRVRLELRGVLKKKTVDGWEAKRDWVVFCSRWRGVKRRADDLRIHPLFAVHRSPLKFLMVRSPSAGDWELLLEVLRPPLPVAPRPTGLRICRACGYRCGGECGKLVGGSSAFGTRPKRSGAAASRRGPRPSRGGS